MIILRGIALVVFSWMVCFPAGWAFQEHVSLALWAVIPVNIALLLVSIMAGVLIFTPPNQSIKIVAEVKSKPTSGEELLDQDLDREIGNPFKAKALDLERKLAAQITGLDQAIKEKAVVLQTLDVYHRERQELRDILRMSLTPTAGTTIAEFDSQPMLIDAAKHFVMLSERLQPIIEVAEKYGWNGVENSKLLWVFLEDELAELVELRNEREQTVNEVARLLGSNNELRLRVVSLGTRLRRLAFAALQVNFALCQHGEAVVPHLMDTDDNDGQAMREEIQLAQVALDNLPNEYKVGTIARGESK